MNKSLIFAAAFATLSTANIAYGQGRFWIYRARPTGTQTTHVFTGAPAGGISTVVAVTRAAYDDITPMPGFAGQAVVAWEWAAVNRNTVAVTSRHRFRVHTPGTTTVGPTGIFDPGTLGVAPIYNISLAANSYTIITGVSTTGALGSVPAVPTFWMGLQFDNNGFTASTTGDQLNNLGMVYFNPTVGTSTDILWKSNTNASSATNNPAGLQSQFITTIQNNFGFGMAVQGQDFTGTLALQDVTAAAYAKTINYSVTSGTMAILSGTVVVATGTSSTAFTITLPNVPPTGATNSYSIVFDGDQFLKKTLNVTAPGGVPVAIPVGSVNMVNGDVDASGEVDAVDIDQVIADFGTVYPGGLSANNDVDVSGEVDAVDIDIVIANFGAVDN